MGIDAGVDREAGELVGRDRELATGERLLFGDEAVAVLFVHGPGGIGKSALTAELARRAGASGRPVAWIDARDVPPSPEALGDALAGLGDLDRPLTLIDSFELIESSAAYLRERLLPSLPEGSALCVAGRNPPGRDWFEGRWADLINEIRLGPLADGEAFELVAAYGIKGEAATRIVAWARGHPLALRLAARLARDGAEWLPGEEAAPEELVRALVRRLGETDVSAGHLPALGVAAIARSTTPALLAATLPEHDAAAEWEWLAGRSFVEPVGEGIALHALLRDSVRADLRHRDPLLERNLKRRIADHVYAVAESTGELNRVLDLSHLIENPGLRWGFMWEASASYYLDSPRPGDAAEIDRILDDPGIEPIGGGKDPWQASRPFFERMPELGVVAKDASGRIVGFTFVPTTAVDAPELEQMPLVGRCLRHARQLEPRGEAVIMPYMCDLTGDPTAGMIGMLANAALLRSSRSNPRYTYMTIGRELELGRVFAETVGAVRVPEADTSIGDRWVDGWLIDFGPGGFLANQRELVYRELNLDPPPRPAERIASVYAEQVRDALRSLDRPVELAASPLASGEGVEERAESVRALLSGAVEAAFGSQPAERLLRDVIVRGYLDPAPSHEAAAEELYLSRSAYFRRLKEAVERVAEYLSSGG
jgi:hypothetical protein